MEWGNWNDPAFRDSMQMLQRGAIAQDQRRQNKQLSQRPTNKCGGVITNLTVANRLYEELGLDSESLPVILDCGFCKTASVAATSCPWCGDDMPWVITRAKELACKRCDKCWDKQKCPHCGKANPSLNLKLVVSPAAIKKYKETFDNIIKQETKKGERSFGVFINVLRIISIFGICFCLYHLVKATTIPPRLWSIGGLGLFSWWFATTFMKHDDGPLPDDEFKEKAIEKAFSRK